MYIDERFNFVVVLLYYLHILSWVARPLCFVQNKDEKSSLAMREYYLSTPCSRNCWHNYPCSCKVLKTFNHHLNHNRKLTEVNKKYFMHSSLIGHTAVGSYILCTLTTI